MKAEQSEIPADRTAAPENSRKRESIFSFFLRYKRFTAALIGGILLDYAGVTPLFVTGLAAAALGPVLLFFACRNTGTKNRQLDT